MQEERDIIMQSLSEFEHLSPANRRKVLQKVKKASQAKAKELIGYEPKTTFDEGIKKFIEWYKENKKLYME